MFRVRVQGDGLVVDVDSVADVVALAKALKLGPTPVQAVIEAAPEPPVKAAKVVPHVRRRARSNPADIEQRRGQLLASLSLETPTPSGKIVQAARGRGVDQHATRFDLQVLERGGALVKDAEGYRLAPSPNGR